jgi:hypothetical protein
LDISLIPMPLEESTPSEYQRVSAEMAQERPDAIIVHDIGDLIPYRELIIELVEKGRLPAMYACGDAVVDQPLQEPERCGSPFLFDRVKKLLAGEHPPPGCLEPYRHRC